MHAYNCNHAYTPGEVVVHEGKVYSRDSNPGHSTPGTELCGWCEIPENQTNLQSYLAVEQSFGDYESRRDAYQAKLAADKASAEAKLAALGLTADEIKALSS